MKTLLVTKSHSSSVYNELLKQPANVADCAAIAFEIPAPGVARLVKSC